MLRTGNLPGKCIPARPRGCKAQPGDHHFFQLMFRPRSLSQSFQGITHKTGCPPLPPTAPRLTLRCPLASLDRTSPPPLSPTCDLPSTWAALQGQTLAGLLSFPWKRLQSTQSWHEELGKSEARSLGLPGFKILCGFGQILLFLCICFFSAYIYNVSNSRIYLSTS